VQARIKLGQKDLSGAEEVLKKAAAAAPQSGPAALALGQMYLISRQPEKAEAEIRRALKLEPKNPGALLALGGIQMASKRIEEAGQTFQQLAALPEKNYKPVHARFLYQSGKKDEARAELEKLAQQDLDDRAVRSLLLALDLEMNKTREAQDLLAVALKRNPKDTDALLQRSALYLKWGKFD
jgi:predicted Zn-dependent protease